MNTSRERSLSDPQHLAIYKPGDCPPARTMRHHRRSCDRVWPPALEVRLARLSMDDGPNVGSNTHIIPLPPPLTYRTSTKQSPSAQEQQQHWDGSGEHRLESIQEVVGTAEGGVKVGRGRGREAREQVVVSAPVSPAERRRNSILGPLSPSVSYQMERHLEQQHANPPHIDIKYLKRCKSVSYYPRNHDAAGRISSPKGHEKGCDVKETYCRYNRHHSLFSPSLNQTTATGTHHHDCYSIAETTSVENDYYREFGEDLFHRRHSNTGSPNPLLRFQQQVERLVTTGEVPRLTMPPHAYRGTAASDRSGNNDDGNKSSSTIQGGSEGTQEPESSILDLPPPHSNPRPPTLPTHKNPLSASSSRVSSRPNSPPSGLCAEHPQGSNPMILAPHPQHLHQRTQPSERHLQAPGLNPAQSETGHLMQQDNSMSFSLGKQPRRISRNPEDLLYHGEDVEPLAGSLTILDMIANDQDRWRSTSMSALTLSSDSRGSSPQHVSQSVESPLTIPRDVTSVPRAGKAHHGWMTSYKHVEAVDMMVEIPLIESHDEVSLEDIRRMEDEERRDRINQDDMGRKEIDEERSKSIRDRIAHMKGEQHAHEEAKLIQEAFHSNRRYDMAS
ncbi:MAG: hypothetical protein J3Q66DRAFT_327468 [Benniella sp.]|nr:MAG: hypothetical protein J3Q66DRAFT_327468 [Benniella sp.]